MGVTEEQFRKDREELILETEEASLAVIEDILELYVLCINDIQKELRSFITKYGKDNVIPYTETRRRLTDKERSTFNTELKAWYREVREKEMDNAYRENLQSLGKRKYITRMEYLQANIRYHVEKLFFNIEMKLFPYFKDVYAYSYYVDTFKLLKNLGLRTDIFDIEDNDIINAVNGKYANTTFKLSLNGNKANLLKELETSIPQGIARGFNIKKLEDIVNMKTAGSRNRSVALTRTETNYLCNKANLDYYKSIGVKKYEYLATLDMRTSDMCRDMDGFIGEVSQAQPGVNFPPIHVHCRSTTIPYIENLSDFGDRVARDKSGRTIKVPRRMTQEEYINKYVPEKYRAKLLRFRDSYRPKIEKK